MLDNPYDDSDLPTVDSMLGVLWESKGTDLLLTAGSRPMIRIDGVLRPLPEGRQLAPRQTELLAKSILHEQQWQKHLTGGDIDFSFGWHGMARIRGNVFRQRNSVAVALRMMPQEIPTFDQLGVPQVVRGWAKLEQGLVLVTGPTGSGKSTTLASLVNWIAINRPVHTITIEDPIEYVYNHALGVVDQRAVGEDTDTFASALRSSLREDPDVILVGELRDLESIRSAVTLAETGHLVFATLHTNDTSQAIDRLTDVFPGDEQSLVRTQLAISLTGIVHQRLLPRIGGGRIAAFEVLVATAPVRNLIKEGRSNQIRNQVVMGRREGMQTLESSLSELVHGGIIDYAEATTRSLYPAEIDGS